MKELGYEEDLMDDGQVDAFKKEPIIYTEIHYDFSAENHVHHDLFTINWDNLIETDRPHIYEMTFEDLYFFNVGHYVKNINSMGMGIRGIIDSFILWNAADDEQKKNILKKFENTELEEFNNNILKITDVWFNGADDDGSLDNVQNYLLETETYGSYRTKLMMGFIDSNEQTVKKTKLQYILERLFPLKEEMYGRFNIKGNPFFLLPFLWLIRLILLPFSKKENKEGRKRYLNNLNKFSKDDLEYEIEIRKEFGIL
jgi:hypothetical protein